MAEIAQGLKGSVLRKNFVLPMKSWFFKFFTFFLGHGSTQCHLQCDSYDSNVLSFYFFQEIYKFHSIEVWSLDPHQQK